MPSQNLMFEDQISFFESLKSDPISITLKDWIGLNRNHNEYSDLITNYRKTCNQSIKKSLPLVTVGGEFTNGRKQVDIIQHTGWIALDVDHKDNMHLPCAAVLRDEIAKLGHVAFSGLSVSGKGVWCLVKVSDPKKQALHFEQLKSDFRHLKIILDPSKGKNANDARFLSYDPEAIVKKDFKIYDRLPPQSKKRRRSKANVKSNGDSNLIGIIDLITKNRVNIAPDYVTYRNIGFAFADEYGEAGRELFHQIVCHSPKYNQKEADRQYTNCLRSGRRGIRMGTFYHYCKQYGLI